MIKKYLIRIFGDQLYNQSGNSLQRLHQLAEFRFPLPAQLALSKQVGNYDMLTVILKRICFMME